MVVAEIVRAGALEPRVDPAHAVSAEAHDQYLTAVAEALAAHPDPGARHRVEHVVQLRDDQLTRIARWRDLVDSDVTTIGSTDMPWLVLALADRAADLPHGSPLEAVHQAVTRQSYLGRTPEN